LFIARGNSLKKSSISIASWMGLALFLLAAGSAYSHSGIVDGYGCHRGPKGKDYHCHQGPFAGQSFKSRQEFLRKLRGSKSELPSPRTPTPPTQNLPKD
jgi:hypothetical protein